MADGPLPAAGVPTVRNSRRRLAFDGIGIMVSGVGFGFVYGLTARTEAGFSPIDVMAMSVLVFAGAAQFAAIGYVAAGVPWPVIGILTGLLNARHVLYSAALGPWFRGRSFGERAVAAQVLSDEVFALSLSHFRRLGRFDAFGYWFAGIVIDFIPWFLGTLSGVLLGDAIVDPERLGLDVIFASAMAGLAVGLITSRRELVAAVVGAVVGVAVSLVVSPTLGIIAGGFVGPAAGLLVPAASAQDRSQSRNKAPTDRLLMSRADKEVPSAAEEKP
jgi:predicted branched-subunit amino acid permease